MTFLVLIFCILVGSVCLLSWISKHWIFGELQPAFVGALVGAAGTIFAACIAYTAASQNIEMAARNAEETRQQKLENERNIKRFAREQASRELQGMRELLSYFDRLLATFEGASEGGSRDYYSYMLDAERNGAIVSYMGNAPDPFRNRAQEMSQRLFGVRNAVVQANNMSAGRPPDQNTSERASLNKSVRERLVEMRAFRTEIDADIRRRERDAVAAE